MSGHERTLSEEFFSRSPNTQAYVKSITTTVPTSKARVEYTNLDEYNKSSPNTRNQMLTHSLLSPNVLAMYPELCKTGKK